MSGAQPLEQVDTALVRLRRLWSGQPQVLDDDGSPVEMSSVLVVEGCARGAVHGTEVSVGTIAEFADVRHSTASRLTDRAVTAGLIARAPSVVDRRRTALVLTPAGQALRARALAFRMRWLRQVLAEWSDRDAAALGELLARFADDVVALGGPGRQPGGG